MFDHNVITQWLRLNSLWRKEERCKGWRRKGLSSSGSTSLETCKIDLEQCQCTHNILRCNKWWWNVTKSCFRTVPSYTRWWRGGGRKNDGQGTSGDNEGQKSWGYGGEPPLKSKAAESLRKARNSKRDSDQNNLQNGLASDSLKYWKLTNKSEAVSMSTHYSAL